MGIDRTTLRAVVADYLDMELPPTVQRDVNIDHLLKMPLGIAIIGPRRAGKTYLLYQIMKELQDRGVERESILYIDFEDDRLAGIDASDVSEIPEVFEEVSGKQAKFAFLDEVQRASNWQRFVRRLMNFGVKVFVTGSNSAVANREYRTELGGRIATFEVLPFSFREFLRARGHKNTVRARKKIKRAAERYIYWGGYPGIATEDNPQVIRETLRSYVETVIYKDVGARYGDNEEGVRLMLKKIAENICNEYTAESLRRSLKAVGYEISTKTVIEYLNHLEETYAALHVRNYRKSFRQRERYRKTYLPDQGIIPLLTVGDNLSKHLENAVYLELRRRYGAENIYYVRGSNGEIDFYVSNKDLYVQVCVDPFGPAAEREMRIMERKADRKIVITMWEEGKMGDVEILPFWKWALEREDKEEEVRVI